MNIDYSPQVDFFDPAKWGWPVHVVGLGSIGSTLLLPLLKLGVGEVHLWDDDIVEPKNIPVQLPYGPESVGKPKVEACADLVRFLGIDVELYTHQERITPTSQLEGVVIVGVDTMDSRRDIWQAVKGSPMVPLIMDARIAGEIVHWYALDPINRDQSEDYETTLYPDEAASELPCGGRNIIHSPLQVATWMISGLTLLSRGETPKYCQMAGLRTMQYV